MKAHGKQKREELRETSVTFGLIKCFTVEN